jgi:hypothetical protein
MYNPPDPKAIPTSQRHQLLAALRRLYRPIRTTAGLDGGEIQGGYRLPILREIQLPEWKEVFAYIHALQTAVRAINEFVDRIHTAPLEVPNYLREIF